MAPMNEREGGRAGGPIPVGITAQERRAMTELRSRLASSPYDVLHSLAAAGQPLVADVASALAIADSGPDWSMYRLLGLGRPVAADELDHEDRIVAELLVEACLAEDDEGLLATSGWILVPALRGHLVTGLPPTHGGAAGASAYLGNDSFKLAGMLPDAAGRRVLDLGTGSGIQGLLACRGSASAVLTDIDEFSLRAAALNAVLNGVSHSVHVFEGSLYEPVADERFDLVVSLPPYMPVAPGSGVTTSAGAGPDGLDVLYPLLAGARQALVEGGELYALAQLLCDDDGPLLRNSLGQSSASLALELYCWDRHPLRPWVTEIAGALSKQPGALPVADLVAGYSASLRALGASGVCTVLVRARAAERPGLRIIGPAGAVLPGSVLRHAGPIVGGPANLESVGLRDGRLSHLDQLGMALLRSIDGNRDLAEAAAAAWGQPDDADWSDIEEMAAWRAGELVRAGLVVDEPPLDAVVFAPFSPDQLALLELVQGGPEPPYTCASTDGAALEVEAAGWRCPVCGARQTWAFAEHAVVG
jgi:SAM-dependent methyltransferase